MPNLAVRILQNQMPHEKVRYILLNNSSSWRVPKGERGLGDSFKLGTRHPLVKLAFDISDRNGTVNYKDNPKATAAMLTLANAFLTGYKKGTSEAIDANPEKAAQIFALLSANPYAAGVYVPSTDLKEPKKPEVTYAQVAYNTLSKLYSKHGPKELANQLEAEGGKSVHELVLQRAKEYNIRQTNSNLAADKLKAQQQARLQDEKQEEEKVVTQPQVIVDMPVLPVAPLFTPKKSAATSAHNVPPTSTTPVLPAAIPTTPKQLLSTSPVQVEKALPQEEAQHGISIQIEAGSETPTNNLDAQLVTEEHEHTLNDTPAQPLTSPVPDELKADAHKPTTPVSNFDEMAYDPNVSPLPPVSPAAKPTSPVNKPASPVATGDNKAEEQAHDKVVTPLPPVSPAAKPASPVNKPASPVAAGENKADEQAHDKVATPLAPVSLVAKPASPVNKPATPVAAGENKADEQAHDKVATPLAPVSPIAKPASPAKKPATPVVDDSKADKKADKHASLFGDDDIPHQLPAPAPTNNTVAPTAPVPTFPNVDKLLEDMNAIVGKHPVGATAAIKAEQMALFCARNNKTLIISPRIKALTYDEVKDLSIKMNKVQLRQAVDPRFNHVRTETGSVRKHLGDGKGETKTWRAMRQALKIQLLLIVVTEARKAQADLAAAQAAEAAQKAAQAAEAGAEAKAVDNSNTAATTPAAGAKFKMAADRFKEVNSLLGQHVGRTYGIFGRRGQTGSQKFFNATFEPEQEVQQTNNATNSPRNK